MPNSKETYFISRSICRIEPFSVLKSVRNIFVDPKWSQVIIVYICQSFKLYLSGIAVNRNLTERSILILFICRLFQRNISIFFPMAKLVQFGLHLFHSLGNFGQLFLLVI